MQEKREINFSDTIYERLKTIRLSHKLTQEEFALSVDCSRSNYSQIELGRQNPTIDILTKIVSKYGVTYDYILEGSESKRENQPALNVVKESFQKYSGKSEKHLPEQLLPLYNIVATAGMVSLFADNANSQPVDTMKIPNLPRCDGAMFIKGDSMYPLLKSGDLVVYKQVPVEYDSILWGHMYLCGIEMNDDEYISVKYIQKSDRGPDHVCLVSQNEHHQSRDILLKNIKALALIKGSFRYNM
jgi:transcriptional regulator with XRE-family HTH domain